jgi:hypothetical protein
MSGPHYISSSNREATWHAAAVYLSPGDVAAYRAAILGAGYVLGGLLSCEFPKAELVSEALYAVTKVVGGWRPICGISRRGLLRRRYIVDSR